MKINAQGTLAFGRPATERAFLTFPALAILHDGSALATCRAGRGKDGPEEHLLMFRARAGTDDWQPVSALPPAPRIDGHSGSLKCAYLTETAPGRVIAVALWVERDTFPGCPLFNPETEGCLPMSILIADSRDSGHSFGDWRRVPISLGGDVPGLTSPILCLPGGELLLGIETNKPYRDSGPWRQRALHLRSTDGGTTWSAPETAADDENMRHFNWDLRLAVWPDGTLASFAWTFDRHDGVWRDIHRRIRRGDGWSQPQPMGIGDQPGVPAVLTDGRILLPWVDRFGSATIRAAIGDGPDARLDSAGSCVLHQQAGSRTHAPETAALLTEMDRWAFGLPFATAVPDGTALVLHYAGTPDATDIVWTRIDPGPAMPPPERTPG